MSVPKIKLALEFEPPLPERKYMFICTQKTVREMKIELNRRFQLQIPRNISLFHNEYELMDDDDVCDLLRPGDKIKVCLPNVIPGAQKKPNAGTQAAAAPEVKQSSASSSRSQRKMKHRKRLEQSIDMHSNEQKQEQQVTISKREHGEPNIKLSNQHSFPAQIAYEQAKALHGKNSTATAKGASSHSGTSDSQSSQDSSDTTDDTQSEDSCVHSGSSNDMPLQLLSVKEPGNAKSTSNTDYSWVRQFSEADLLDMIKVQASDVRPGWIIGYKVLEIKSDVVPMVSALKIGVVEQATPAEISIRVLHEFSQDTKVSKRTKLRKVQFMLDSPRDDQYQVYHPSSFIEIRIIKRAI